MKNTDNKRFSVNIAIESTMSDTLIIVWGVPNVPMAQFNQFTSISETDTKKEEVMIIKFDTKSVLSFGNKPTMHLKEVHCSLFENSNLYIEMTKKPVNFMSALQSIQFEQSKYDYSVFLIESSSPLLIKPLTANELAKFNITDGLNL